MSQSHNEAFTRDGGTTPENTAIPPVDSPTAGDSQSLERVQREGERDLYAEDVQINREGLVTQLLAQLSPAERSNPSFVSTWQGRTETDPMICIACLREFEEKRRSGKRISEQGRFMNDIFHKLKRNRRPSSGQADHQKGF